MLRPLPLALALLAGLVHHALAQDAKPLGERLYGVVAAGLPHEFPGYRANHAKGGVFEGQFTPSPDAKGLSSAAPFQGGSVKLVIRFSNAGGIPDAPDNAPSAVIRAMAFSVLMPDGSSTDLMCISAPVFVVRTPEDFIGFNKALRASGPNAPEPKPVATWIATHPETQRFIAIPKPMPQSYATQDYFAIHAYKLTDAMGASHFVRFRIVPEAGLKFRSAEEAKAAPPNALLDELRDRVAAGPVKYRLVVQVAAAGDPTNDPTIAWPDSRPVVDLGEIEVTSAVADSLEAEKKLGFLPNKAIKGWEPSDDPFLDARADAYAVAYGKRNP